MNCSWNYRVVLVNGEYGLYEVFYEDGKIISRTVDPIDFVEDSVYELGVSLKLALDATLKPVLDDSIFGK